MRKTPLRVAGTRRAQPPSAPSVENGAGETNRRGFLRSAATFSAGAAVTALAGVGTSYFSEVAKAVDPPAEIADSQAGDLPVRAIALLERRDGDQGELWYFPYALSSRPVVQQRITGGDFADESERLRFYYQNGAVDISVSHVKLVLEGRRNGGIQVLDVRAKTAKSSVPTQGGTLLTPGPQGAGHSEKMGFDLDMDGVDLPALTVSSDPDVYPWNDRFFNKETYFSGADGKTMSLARNEQQVIEITARTNKYSVEWTMDLVLLVDGKRSVQKIAVGGQPVRTVADGVSASAFGADEVYIYSNFAGVVSKSPTRSFVRKK